VYFQLDRIPVATGLFLPCVLRDVERPCDSLKSFRIRDVYRLHREELDAIDCHLPARLGKLADDIMRSLLFFGCSFGGWFHFRPYQCLSTLIETIELRKIETRFWDFVTDLLRLWGANIRCQKLSDLGGVSQGIANGKALTI